MKRSALSNRRSRYDHTMPVRCEMDEMTEEEYEVRRKRLVDEL